MKKVNIVFAILFVIVNFVASLITLVGVGLTQGAVFWELISIIMIPPNFVLLLIYLIVRKLVKRKENVKIEVENNYDSTKIKKLNVYSMIVLAVVNAICWPKYFIMSSMGEWFFSLPIVVVPNFICIIVYLILHFMLSKKVKFQ